MSIAKVKEKSCVSNSTKEKIQAAPKELFRRGLLTGTEKLHGQLRDAAEGGRQEGTEVECVQNSARAATRQAVNRLEKLAHGKKKVCTGRLEYHRDADETRPDFSTPDIQTEQAGPSDITEPVRIKTREAADQSVPVEGRRSDSSGFEPSQIKTKDSCIKSQTVVSAQESAIKNDIQPEYQASHSPEQGRQKALLKQVFWDMNQLSGFTSTVSGGGGDVEDTTTLYITVTARTADEMADIYGFTADQRRHLTELLSDEYRELWNAVLYGIGSGSGEIVAVALSQVGNVGGQPYWSWYGFSSRVEWCACFVSWCANECGYIDAGVIPRFSGCVQGSRWFKEQGLWQDKSYTPNPGDIIFFDWDDPGGYSGPQDGVPDHVGIVEKVENGRVYTIEGNSGDKCCQRSYPLGYYEIYGYGVLCLGE